VTWSLFALTVLGLVGLMVGSFLNVCIYRLPRGESLAWPGSHCPSCGAAIHWYDNVPLVSYVRLAARCRACRAPIDLRYPIVELATMALFLAHVWVIGWEPLLPVRITFGCAMIVLFAIDLEHQILPNAITLPGIAVGLAASVWLPPGWQSALAGAALGGASLWLLFEIWMRLRGVEALGMGDVKMLAMVGAFLGWQQVIVTLVLSSFLGSVVGVGLIAAGRGSLGSKLPYGTFIALGAIVSSLAGEPLVAWYLSFYGARP
jgi:leader peptidase (prepilin peptidase)/N-methyltransferase